MGMIDKALMMADNIAFGTAPSGVDLGYTFKPGSGQMLKGKVQGVGVTGVTALVVRTGATAAAATTIATIPMTSAQMIAGYSFAVPVEDVQRFVSVTFTGITAGTGINAWIGLDQQTA